MDLVGVTLVNQAGAVFKGQLLGHQAKLVDPVGNVGSLLGDRATADDGVGIFVDPVVKDRGPLVVTGVKMGDTKRSSQSIVRPKTW